MVEQYVRRSKQNVGTCVDNRPPTVIHSQVDIHRYSVANIYITKTSTTEVVSLTVIFTAYHYYCVYSAEASVILVSSYY